MKHRYAAYYRMMGLLLEAAGLSCTICAQGIVPHVNDNYCWHDLDARFTSGPDVNGMVRNGTSCPASHIWQLSDLKAFLHERTRPSD